MTAMCGANFKAIQSFKNHKSKTTAGKVKTILCPPKNSLSTKPLKRRRWRPTFSMVYQSTSLLKSLHTRNQVSTHFLSKFLEAERTCIIKNWFKALTVEERTVAMTIVDKDLYEMLKSMYRVEYEQGQGGG